MKSFRTEEFQEEFQDRVSGQTKLPPSSKANQRTGPGTPLSVRRVRTVIVLLQLSLTGLERVDAGVSGTKEFPEEFPGQIAQPPSEPLFVAVCHYF
jgi:hypothetical protein